MPRKKTDIHQTPLNVDTLTLGRHGAVEGIPRHQHTLPAALALGLQDVDGLDGVTEATLPIGRLHGGRSVHHHVGEERRVTGHPASRTNTGTHKNIPAVTVSLVAKFANIVVVSKVIISIGYSFFAKAVK